MNKNKKILVSDYDQTFYLNDEDIEKNKNAVNNFREKGNISVDELKEVAKKECNSVSELINQIM